MARLFVLFSLVIGVHFRVLLGCKRLTFCLVSFSGWGDTGGGFQHLTVDPSTGRIYVGAVNRLFQLDAGLRVEAAVTTGPMPDSPHCHASGCPSEVVDTVQTDNSNKVRRRFAFRVPRCPRLIERLWPKVLVVDQDARTLLACGSIYQGACTKYRLSNISAEPEFISRNVAANDESSSTFAFIGPEHYNPYASYCLFAALRVTFP